MSIHFCYDEITNNFYEIKSIVNLDQYKLEFARQNNLAYNKFVGLKNKKDSGNFYTMFDEVSKKNVLIGDETVMFPIETICKENIFGLFQGIAFVRGKLIENPESLFQ